MTRRRSSSMAKRRYWTSLVSANKNTMHVHVHVCIVYNYVYTYDRHYAPPFFPLPFSLLSPSCPRPLSLSPTHSSLPLALILFLSLSTERERRLPVDDLGDPKQRLALHVVKNKCNFVPEHVEERTLYNPVTPNISMVTHLSRLLECLNIIMYAHCTCTCFNER